MLSSRGGKWKDSEITVLWNPGITDLAEIIQNTVADYLFIYYAGHGYETTNSERKICLKDADVSDFFLFNKCPRQLVIIDACREKEYPAISGIPKEEEWLHFDGYYPEREAFDNYILQSPPGKKIIHATKSGFASWEDINGRGGIFTTSLLLGIRKVQCSNLYAPISIEQSLRSAHKIIKESGDEQEPEIVYSIGHLEVPLALYIKSEEKKMYSRPPVLNKPRNISGKASANSGALAFGLIVLGIVLLASNSE